MGGVHPLAALAGNFRQIRLPRIAVRQEDHPGQARPAHPRYQGLGPRPPAAVEIGATALVHLPQGLEQDFLVAARRQGARQVT